jgi:hypothetical protein
MTGVENVGAFIRAKVWLENNLSFLFLIPFKSTILKRLSIFNSICYSLKAYIKLLTLKELYN